MMISLCGSLSFLSTIPTELLNYKLKIRLNTKETCRNVVFAVVGENGRRLIQLLLCTVADQKCTMIRYTFTYKLAMARPQLFFLFSKRRQRRRIVLESID